uniref:Serpin domain-containing protein n=1 Tax=Meloidogyne enterolobii TaxID=390850 RepID=A0A6V7XAQ0_MELEN|nr:unnamed protein product [Meloidogyne enterolobii]
MFILLFTPIFCLNEEGTEAAAATGLGIMPTSWQPTPKFSANHPFVFMLVNNDNEIIFCGIFQG